METDATQMRIPKQKPDTGGQAFTGWQPEHLDEGFTVCAQSSKGMTLLDYFAGQVVMGLVSNASEAKGIDAVSRKSGKTYQGIMAEYSYNVAEAMVAEKRRREQSQARGES